MCVNNSRAQVADITRFPVQINYIMRKTDGIFQSRDKNGFLVTYLKQYARIETCLLHRKGKDCYVFNNRGIDCHEAVFQTVTARQNCD